jgi:imidazolonepropionase-like amidohydrolase
VPRFLIALVALVAQPLAAQATAFVGVNVIPMDSERVIADQIVLVENGRITAMGPTAATTIPAGTFTVDGRGKYLMPGLAEMHAHVPPQTTDPQLLADIMYLYVANGVTTIRGMLGAPYQLELREKLRSGEMLGPRFYVGAPSLNGNTAPDPATAARLMREHKAAGYDLVKLHPGVSRAAYDSAVAVGRQVGITIAGHVPTDVGIHHAIETRLTTVDHLDGYIEGAVSDAMLARIASPTDQVTLPEAWAEVTTDRLRGLARATRRAGIAVVPTMFLWENLWLPPVGEEIENRPEMRYVPLPWVNGWRNQINNRLNFNRANNLDEGTIREMLERRRELLRILQQEGVPILMGTDSPQLLNVPGFALHREIKVMVEAGLTPYQVLVSGTTNVRDYVRNVLRQQAEFGTVAVGQEADLVLLDGNPLESIDNLSRRSGVMVRGRWIPASELTAGLEEMARRRGRP